MNNQLRRILSLTLAVLMLMGMAACAAPTRHENQTQAAPTAPSQPPAVQLENQTPVTDQLTREEKEEIVQILGTGSE